MEVFIKDILDIQPSQLYINSEKLKKVNTYLDEINNIDIDPIPIKKFGNTVFFTDGHTRAFALYKRGIKKIKVYWDNDDLSWEAYLTCLDWCQNEGILNISDLGKNVLDDRGYKDLWYDRTKKLHELLDKNPLYYMKINEVINSKEKSEISEAILRSLPNWFGIEGSIIDYIESLKDTLFFVATIGEIPIGFISIKDHFESTSEIYVMGILKEYHRLGIGKKLISIVENELSSTKKFLTVKTLSDSHPDKYYKRTREFYKYIGFYPLEEFKTLWDENNPCLFLVKNIEG